MIQSFACAIPVVPLADVEQAVLAQLPVNAQLVRWAVVEALTDAATWRVEGAYYTRSKH
jgi:hypothetical protein